MVEARFHCHLLLRGTMADSRPVTYGEFPELFSGFPPEHPVNLDDRRTITRLMMAADPEVTRVLLTDDRRKRWEAPMRREEEESRALLARLRESNLTDPGIPEPEDEE